MDLIDNIEECIDISLEEQNIKLPEGVIEQLASDINISIEYYNEVGIGPVENPLIYQMKEKERDHERSVDDLEKSHHKRISEKDDTIRSLRHKIWNLEEKLGGEHKWKLIGKK